MRGAQLRVSSCFPVDLVPRHLHKLRTKLTDPFFYLVSPPNFLFFKMKGEQRCWQRFDGVWGHSHTLARAPKPASTLPRATSPTSAKHKSRTNFKGSPPSCSQPGHEPRQLLGRNSKALGPAASRTGYGSEPIKTGSRPCLGSATQL